MPTDMANADSADSRPHYVFKPTLMGPPWQFHLAPDAIEWEAGRRSGRIAYGDIRRLRLSFRPVTTQSQRFLAEIWPAEGGKLRIASSSWRSMVEQERQDPAYAGFVIELHRRVAAIQPGLRCESGTAPLLYWSGIAIFVAVGLGLAALVVRAVQTQLWAGAATVAAFLALFLWQAGAFFQRNRPGIYAPASPPPRVLPRLRS
jgi:hypothetical protein